MRLERLDIQRLRGIPAGWPTLELGENGLIVYGPNGSGKSSIIDALERTITGRSTLFEDNRLGVNWDTASDHVLGGPASTHIHGTISGKPITLTLGEPPPIELEKWLAAGRAASFVLRRYMLLNFINDEPRHRYGQIEPFLNLREFMNLESGLKQKCDALETSIVGGATQLSTLVQRVRQIFSLPPGAEVRRPILIAMLWDKLNAAGMQVHENDLGDLQALSARLQTELGGDEISQRLATLGAAKAQLLQITNISLLKPIYEDVLRCSGTLQQALTLSVKRVPVTLLEAAHEHVISHMSNACPVCEQTVDPAILLTQLQERIREDQTVAMAARALDESLRAMKSAAQSFLQRCQAFISIWSNIGLGDLPPEYAASIATVERLAQQTSTTVESEKNAIQKALDDADISIHKEAAKLDAAIVATGGGMRRTLVLDATRYLNALQTDLTAIEQLSQKQKTMVLQRSSSIVLHNHAVEARKGAVQTIADRVADLANEFYEEIHPGEGIAKSKLTVRAAATASMNLLTDFHGREASPLAYYSESHLDTLGLCYFLAIRKLELQEHPEFKLLLMDDVLHSVDAAHRVRLARLLHGHFRDLQLVFVTHDKIFYDRLREVLGSGYKYVAITGWDLTAGPKLSDPFTDLDVVTDPTAREGKSHIDIAAAAGRFMEYHLKKIAEGLQIALQARFSREHDLGSLWPPVAKALRKQAGFKAKHQGLVTDLDDSDWVRNKIAAHDNEPESPVVPQEVFLFVDRLAALYSATYCAECRSVIRKSNAEAWRCECSTQYLP